MPIDRLTRLPEYGSTNRADLDALLDDQVLATVVCVVKGQPWVVPMLFARDGDHVLIHGSTGAGTLRHLAAGAPAAVSVTSLDGIVVAATTFDSSAQYRSAVIRGRFTVLEREERARALDVLSDRVIPGRTNEVRGSSAKEYAATLALAMPITPGGWVHKASLDGPDTPQGDDGVGVWGGVVPLRTVAGDPEPAAWSDAPVPASVLRLVERHG